MHKWWIFKTPFIDRPIHVVPYDIHGHEATIHDGNADCPETQSWYWNTNTNAKIRKYKKNEIRMYRDSGEVVSAM